MQTTTSDLIKAIQYFTEHELTQMIHAVTDRRDYLRAKDLEGFRVGDKVFWEKGRGTDKETFKGTVEKVNRKTIGIKESGRPWMHWRCSPSLLTKVKGDE